MDLFYSIAYVECHDSQSAATIKFWFDNKYITFLALYMRIYELNVYLLAISKAVEQALHSQILHKAIPSALYLKVSLVLPVISPKSESLIFLIQNPLCVVMDDLNYSHQQPRLEGPPLSPPVAVSGAVVLVAWDAV
jgi:hypothetical protein